MTVIGPRNVNCNKGLIATQAKPVCIILHSIKEITSDERKTLTKISTRNLSRQFPQTSAHYMHDKIRNEKNIKKEEGPCTCLSGMCASNELSATNVGYNRELIPGSI